MVRSGRWCGILLACLGVACVAERQEPTPSAQAGAATTGGAGAGQPTTSSGSGGAGAGTGAGEPLPLPTPPDCACLAAVGDEACRGCLDEAGADTCALEWDDCDDDGEAYCALVLDCLALCVTADAYCVDVCLGSEDEARQRVEAFTACACGACAAACGAGDCG